MENTAVEKHSKKNIKSGTIIGYISLAINIVSGFLFVPLILGQIGNQYGLFSLATSIVNLFLLDFGLSQTANTFLAKKRAAGDEQGIRDIIGVFYKLYLIIDLFFIVFFVGYYFLIDFIYQGLTPAELADFKIVFIICIGYSIISLPATTLDGTLSAYEEYGVLKLTELIQRIVYIVMTVFTLYFHWGLFLFVSAHAVSTIVSIFIRYLLVRYKLGIKANFKMKLTKDVLKPIIFFSIWTAIISILARFPFNLSPNILGIMSDSTNVTVFGIASTIEGYAYLISAVIAGFFLPKVARIMKQDKEVAKRELASLAKKVAFIQLFVICIIFAGFVVCGKPFITLWLEDYATYEMAYYGIIMLLVSLILTIPVTIYNNALYIKGHVKEIAIIDIFSIALFVGLCFLFSFMYGSLGACLAILISKAIGFTCKLFIYKKKLEANISNFILNTYVKYFIPIGFTILIVWLGRANAYISWGNLLISIISCIAIYIPSVIPFINQDVLKTVKEVLKLK